MLLSDKRILEEKEQGNIVIEPFDTRQLGTNSYDCRLGEWYYQGDANVEVMHMDNPDEIRRYWGDVRKAVDGRIAIRPGTTILAHTQEIIGGRNGYLGKMYSRSTVARSGLSVCRCAGIGDVGYINRWTMEISNHTQTVIVVPVGFRICQITFEYVGETLKEYRGKYGQREWMPEDMLPKPHLDWDRAMYSSSQQEEEVQPSETEGKEKTYRLIDGIWMAVRQEMRCCNRQSKPTCKRCFPEPGVRQRGHGPYWYGSYQDESGKYRRIYLGRELPSESGVA